ncbi:hypothetical protein BS47DRAFT_1373971 [Hydnum rufescens UP504]|uniref:dolichol kinase n=1 Tax=Hydnum rufescens UP504 TaxID=1448309 RepID=A0A9P6DMR0_9AGAM|nr:hypothetical protein BS47DRAFT_1373971 [Hydnum rufescens UP504]
MFPVIFFFSLMRHKRYNLDDGYLTALLIGPGLAASVLYQTTILSSQALPYRSPSWLVEPPFRQRFFANAGISDALPQSEARRTLFYCALMCSTTLALIVFRSFGHTYVDLPDLLAWSVPVTTHILSDSSNFDVCVISTCYQFTFYLLIRLARGGFTLGEVGIVAQGATALFIETVNITRFRIWPQTTPFVKTFRVPGPLLMFQLALIPGQYLLKPSRRLKYPEQREFQRRALASGFYLGVLLIVGAVIGTWTQWCLEGRNPWLWMIFWLAEGRSPGSRPGLIAYWFWMALFSIVWWNSQLVSGGRHRMLHPPASHGSNTAGTEDDEVGTGRAGFLIVNGRRKCFHALASLCLPLGLCLTVAFSVFIFAEYVRYFALYPFGAAVHRFLSEFLDEKDSGSAILSHFYLLTGCAGPLWLERLAPSRLLDFTGVLVLGTSVAGKRFGRHPWSHASGKTIEGSAAFAISVFLCALLLQLCPVVEPFSVWRYFLCTCASAPLEAFSTQSDNAVLPFFTTSLLVLAGT